MEKRVFERFDDEQITECMLEEASVLFSNHYGFWSPKAEEVLGPFAKAGRRVKLNKERIRTQNLPEGANWSYVRVVINSHLVGNVFACHWKNKDETVCWVTQLVVHRNYRERGLATGLLTMLKNEEDTAYGIISSHPAACLAAVRAFAGQSVLSLEIKMPMRSFDHGSSRLELLMPMGSIGRVQTAFIIDQAVNLMSSSPVEYVRAAKPCGTLFDQTDVTGRVSSAQSGFYVDHNKPLLALGRVRQHGVWPFGKLHEGEEFLVLLPSALGRGF